MHGWGDAEKERWKQRRVGGWMDEWVHACVERCREGKMEAKRKGVWKEGRADM